MKVTKCIIKFILLLVIAISTSMSAFAHPGRTDSNGGHWNRKTGTYHYHNGGSSGSSSITIGDLTEETKKELSQKENELTEKQNELIKKISDLENQIGDLNKLKKEIEDLIWELETKYHQYIDFQYKYVSIPYISLELAKYYTENNKYITRTSKDIWELDISIWESNLRSSEKEISEQDKKINDTKANLLQHKNYLLKIKNEIDAKNELQENTKSLSKENNINMYKTWTIKFNKKINPNTIKNNIIVEDSEGNIIDVIVEVNKNIVEIKAPKNGYKPGKYIIKINNGLKSETNKKINKSYTKEFIVEDTKDIMNQQLIVNSELNMDYVSWIQEYDISKNKEISVDINNDGVKEGIILGMDTPNGTKVIITRGNIGYNLMYDASIMKNQELFDEYGELGNGYMLQVCFFDFDNDGIKEVIVAAGDKVTNLSVSIFKYSPSKINNPFEEIGYIEGQNKIIIKKDSTIEVPYGSQGLFDKYEYNNNKLQKRY